MANLQAPCLLFDLPSLYPTPQNWADEGDWERERERTFLFSRTRMRRASPKGVVARLPKPPEMDSSANGSRASFRSGQVTSATYRYPINPADISVAAFSHRTRSFVRRRGQSSATRRGAGPAICQTRDRQDRFALPAMRGEAKKRQGSRCRP